MELVMNVSDISRCYQCGTCTGDCPVAWVNRDFNPRRLVLSLQQSNGENVDRWEFWLCAMCFKCLRCPRDVKPVEVFSTMRKLAVERGVENRGTKLVKAFVEVIEEYGRLIETKFMMKFMGLESIKMLPPSVAFKMWRNGKVSLSAKRSECAEEVRRMFEVCRNA